jgi:predicted DNA-binding transcriptional regulator AlpA
MNARHERPRLQRAEAAVGETSQHVDPTAPAAGAPVQYVARLLWGWREVLAATGIPRRSLEREIAASRFPRPIRRVGRRPFWRPEDVRRWAEGGGQL